MVAQDVPELGTGLGLGLAAAPADDPLARRGVADGDFGDVALPLRVPVDAALTAFPAGLLGLVGALAPWRTAARCTPRGAKIGRGPGCCYGWNRCRANESVYAGRRWFGDRRPRVSPKI